MNTTASAESVSVESGSQAFTSARLIYLFPRHETVKLDDNNFIQWKQHIRLIIEGYELAGFLDGTIPIPPCFLTSPEGSLVPNPDALAFFQQDKLLASWLLLTISLPLLTFFYRGLFGLRRVEHSYVPLHSDDRLEALLSSS